ncbi:MAG TPA: substrate-binding domain-containing protein [Bacteroidota bacterium]|nr:substrate-binding domain-containing protein [Bacteroidota bacterium]
MKSNLWIRVLVAAAVFGIAGCTQERKETPTKGNLIMVVDEAIAPLMEKERSQFEQLYVQAHIQSDTAQARAALVKFFDIDTVKLVAISRPLNAEEREVAKRTKLDFAEYKVALNAVAIIVNNDNKVDSLRTTQLDSIYTGLANKWNAYGWTNPVVPIEVCLPNQNSMAFEVVAVKVLNGAKYAAPAAIENSSNDMINFVANHSGALGMVSIDCLAGSTDRVKVLRLNDPFAPDTLGEKGVYYSPHQAYIYQHYYPLTTEVYLYSKADMYSVAAGLITFITSYPGQQIAVNSGLAPATMPVRLVETTQKEIQQ